MVNESVTPLQLTEKDEVCLHRDSVSMSEFTYVLPVGFYNFRDHHLATDVVFRLVRDL